MRTTAEQAGQRIETIVLTHGHQDHSAGAPRLAELTGAPVLAVDPAHRRGGEAGGGSRRRVQAGGCELRVIETPGPPDSVCLLLEPDGAVLTGDTVLGRGATVIADDGNLGDYLGSLDRLRALAGPGEPAGPAARARTAAGRPGGDAGLLHHAPGRTARRDPASLEAGETTLAGIVARVYVDVDRACGHSPSGRCAPSSRTWPSAAPSRPA